MILLLIITRETLSCTSKFRFSIGLITIFAKKNKQEENFATEKLILLH